jgi:hypothetical protein
LEKGRRRKDKKVSDEKLEKVRGKVAYTRKFGMTSWGSERRQPRKFNPKSRGK